MVCTCGFRRKEHIETVRFRGRTSCLRHRGYIAIDYLRSCWNSMNHGPDLLSKYYHFTEYRRKIITTTTAFIPVASKASQPRGPGSVITGLLKFDFRNPMVIPRLDQSSVYLRALSFPYTTAKDVPDSCVTNGRPTALVYSHFQSDLWDKIGW